MGGNGVSTVSSGGMASTSTAGVGGSAASGPMVDRSDPQLHELMIEPAAIDPNVTQYLEPQFAMLDTRVEPLGKLVIFLGGYGNAPSNWRDHGRMIASFGFHVLIPTYDNAWDCSGFGGNCEKDTRWEALVGEDTSPAVDIPRADSAEGRVVRMLEFLPQAIPQGDWTYYLSGGELRYDDIIIAGISWGAASTGLYASRRPFWRAVMHSGCYPYIDTPPATPIERFFGLSHTDDSLHPDYLGAWDFAGLPGPPTSIDGAAPPYGGAQQLITSVPNGYPHCSVAVSGDSPTDGSGGYVFEPAWRYMYGVAEL